MAYITHHPSLPLLVAASKGTLPLARRPPHTTKDTPLHLFNLRGHGKEWYKLLQLDSMDAFVFRARYPAIVSEMLCIAWYSSTYNQPLCHAHTTPTPHPHLLGEFWGEQEHCPGVPGKEHAPSHLFPRCSRGQPT